MMAHSIYYKLNLKIYTWVYGKAISDPTIQDKSRLQIKVNFPEVNPAFDTYRLGTMLELVRDIALAQAYDGKRVRICVQQPLGEGIFVGLPLALASMRKVMEKMDWGARVNAQLNEKDEKERDLRSKTELKFNSDIIEKPQEVKKVQNSGVTSTEADTFIRFGAIGADQVLLLFLLIYIPS